jgi:hypothetical protein
MIITDFGIQDNLNMNTDTDDKVKYLASFYDTNLLNQLSKEQIEQVFDKTKPAIVKIKDLENTNINSYLINSPDGFVPAVEWRNKGEKPCVYIELENKTSIVSSTDHFFELDNSNWKYAKFLTTFDKLKTKYGILRVVKIENRDTQTVYDFHINHTNHRYYTNGISSHNSGAGKSLFLANLGVNWALAGMNVLYLTFELSENLVSMRVDSMVTGITTRDIFKSIDDVEMRVKMIGKKAGAFQVKYMPSGKTANDIRSYIKEYEIKTGRKVDALLIDYLDLMMPVGVKVSAENLFVKDKYVSEELRNLAMELNTVFVTASQLNRAAVEEIEFDHSHISGGLSKIQTADNVIGIFTSRAMRERGRYQIQLMKTRSSSGVGSKVDLAFDIDTLRITDLGEDAQEETSTGSDIVKNLRRTNAGPAASIGADDPAPRAEVGSTRLRQFLNTLDSK